MADTYERILLTHDGSELASVAVHHAEILARTNDAEVIVLQVVDSATKLIALASAGAMEPGAGMMSAEMAAEAADAQRRDAQVNLEAVARQLRADGVERVQTVLREGDAEHEIVDAARELECDVIVMSTHGRTGLGRAVLGSVADHVVRNTPHSAVLVVRPSGD